jgi:PAS domain S-box-containing protein
MPRTTHTKTIHDLRRDKRNLERLCRLAAEIAKLGSEHDTLKTIVDAAAEIVGVHAAHIALVDQYDQELYGVVSSGLHPPDAPRVRCQLPQSSAARQALKGRKVVAIARAAGDRRVDPRARTLLSIGGVVYLPLRSAGQSFGLLILVSRRPRLWTRGELRLARHFANFAAVALENSRLLSRLAETEGRFRSLVEHIPAIIYTCEVEAPYRTIYVSPQTQATLGYSPKEWVDDGSFFMKLVHPEDLGALIDRAETAAKGRSFAAAEYRLLDRRGETRWFRDEAVLVRDPSGQPIAWHGVLVEITGIKEMRQVRAPQPVLGRSLHRTSPERPRQT